MSVHLDVFEYARVYVTALRSSNPIFSHIFETDQGQEREKDVHGQMLNVINTTVPQQSITYSIERPHEHTIDSSSKFR